MVPDPSMSDAEFLHQRRREQDRAERLGVLPRLDIGKVRVDENAMARIGGLCFIRRRLPYQEMVAEDFKTFYEALYGTQGGGMDPSREPVDTSPIAHDSGMAAKIDRSRKIRDLERDLPKSDFRELVRVIVLGAPAGEGLSWRRRQKAVDDLLRILDTVAALWGRKSKAA